MIIDIIQLFKKDLHDNVIRTSPLCFLDIRTIRIVAVKDDGVPHLYLDSIPFQFKTTKSAVNAARLIVDMISEARETDRLELASVHASQAGKAMKEVIQDVSDED
jgi:hypothetical protein